MTTKIEWCDMTWNPAWGCLNNCPYCYAAKIAKRFGEKYGIKDFKPTWIESNFNKKKKKKPSTIFVNSMSDVSFWKDEWMSKVLDKIEKYPQHTFLFLTKDIEYYRNFTFHDNCWLGYTFNTQKQIYNYMKGYNSYYPYKNKNFVSLEPIQEKIRIPFHLDWLIVGAETGNRKNKIIPKYEWIEQLKVDCKDGDIPIFLKDNLKPIMGNDLIQEFPK
jgi:protein gp37